jgi:hypothetical protein
MTGVDRSDDRSVAAFRLLAMKTAERTVVSGGRCQKKGPSIRDTKAVPAEQMRWAGAGSNRRPSAFQA